MQDAPAPDLASDHDTQSPPHETSSPDSSSGAGQQQNHAPWARLVCVQSMYPNIQIWKDAFTVGRMDVQGDKRISKCHCKILRDASSKTISIINLSGNGTLVGGHLLRNEEFTTLQQGDEIVLGPHPSGYPMYIFQLLDKNQQSDKKRTGQFLDANMATKDCLDKTSSVNKKRLKMSQNVQNLKCCICLNMWHDVVSVAPCLHNFCNGCFSEWYRRTESERCTCPQCRASILSVGRNHTLRNLVEELLEENPSLKRSMEDIAKMESAAIVKSDFMKLATMNSEESDNEVSEDFESEGCPQCSSRDHLQDSANTTEFRCGPETVHLMCSACYTLMPERPDLNIPQNCAGCRRAFCDAYWRSQSVAIRNGVRVGCIISESLKPMEERSVSDMPRGAFKGNAYEQDVTRRYMLEQNLVIQDVVRDWLNKLDRGEIEQPKISDNPSTSISSASYVCNQCTDTIIQHLLYKFRLSVPKNELPPDAAGREDCWYGHCCRTQFHNEPHAHKLNHVCEPTRRRYQNH